MFLKDVCHPEERRIFFALLIADFYSEEDSSFLPMTFFKTTVILRNEGSILHHARSLCMFTNRFFVPQNDRVERTVFTSFPPSEAPDFKTQHDRVKRIVSIFIIAGKLYI
jgi:hypothetical protein